MQNIISIKIKTLSNLFIGGMPLPFEIGGIDQQTAVDQEGYPCIPGSSFKGTLRTIIREDNSEFAEKIKQLYANYMSKLEEQSKDYIKKQKEETKIRIEKKYKKAKEEVSSEYLFGIEDFNDTPKLLFSDLVLTSDKSSFCFSIDMKTSIKSDGTTLSSNPRTYKTAKCGLVFEGEIRFYKIELLGDKAVELCRDYISYNLQKFNDGIYRLGNSKSRGYGKIEIL